MTIRKQLIRTVLAALPFIALLVVVRPSSLPIFMLVVPFILLFLLGYNLWLLIAVCARRLLGHSSGIPAATKRTGRALSGFFVLLALLDSVGQLSLRDIVTLILVFILGYFYATRMAKQRRPI